MDKVTFYDDLKKSYLKDPTCQATALHKIKNVLFNPDTELRKNAACNLMIFNNQLLGLWPLEKISKDLDLSYDMMVFDHQLDKSTDYDEEIYFKLSIKSEDIVEDHSNTRYDFKTVTFDEAKEVSDFINRCYESTDVTEGRVKSWMQSPLHFPQACIWITDSSTGVKQGLGIAEKDSEINEGALEWIQIHPDHQGKGLGKLLVGEMLSRMKASCDFISVSGLTSEHAPERLYRACGFAGDRLWYVYRKNKG